MNLTGRHLIPRADRVQSRASRPPRCSFRSMPTALPRRGLRPGRTIYSCRTTQPTAMPKAAPRRKKTGRTPSAGVSLNDEPADVADILIDLAPRGTRTFSEPIRPPLLGEKKKKFGEMKNHREVHKPPLEICGFRVLKAPDVPSVRSAWLCSNKSDMENLVSDVWRTRMLIDCAGGRHFPRAKKRATTPERRTETAGPANRGCTKPCLATAERPYNKPKSPDAPLIDRAGALDCFIIYCVGRPPAEPDSRGT